MYSVSNDLGNLAPLLADKLLRAASVYGVD